MRLPDSLVQSGSYGACTESNDSDGLAATTYVANHSEFMASVTNSRSSHETSEK